ncbi:MAG: glycosyltransferase [Glaciihabitans sp.]
MTYAASGRDFLIERGGLDPARVTAIGNSTDTDVLRAETLKLRSGHQKRATSDSGFHALYIGGLDPAKRIDFLLEAAEAAFNSDNSFRLTIVGRGILEPQVQEAARRNRFIAHITESRAADLALLAHSADAIWMPGRVGLVAVDALAVGLPVHTTNYPHHAPEVEFLRGEELQFLTDSPDEFALESLRRASGTKPLLRDDIPTIESVAQKFVGVVREAQSFSVAK